MIIIDVTVNDNNNDNHNNENVGNDSHNIDDNVLIYEKVNKVISILAYRYRQ